MGCGPEGNYGLQVERCDECWSGVASPAFDAEYQQHPICRAVLRFEVAKFERETPRLEVAA